MISSDRPFTTVPAVVAIPVKNEAERIVDCLFALAAQDPAPGIVLLVNDTTDATIAIVSEVAESIDMPIATIQHDFGLKAGSAGVARHLAMDHADRLAPPDAPLLCTDADGRVARDWLACNLAHLRQGADAVFGRAVIDPVEAARIPPGLHEADRLECAYAASLDEIAHWIDPDPSDPWPRHVEHSGASIAVSRCLFHRVGGIPPIALGEDRAFAAALQRVDARIRHPMEVTVEVSGRILGRALGGMADTIRRRLVAPDPFLDDALEPVAARITRLWRRRALRIACAINQMPFGAARAIEEARHPLQRMAVCDLPAQMDAAESELNRLREPVTLVGAGAALV